MKRDRRGGHSTVERSEKIQRLTPTGKISYQREMPSNILFALLTEGLYAVTPKMRGHSYSKYVQMNTPNTVLLGPSQSRVSPTVCRLSTQFHPRREPQARVNRLEPRICPLSARAHLALGVGDRLRPAMNCAASGFRPSTTYVLAQHARLGVIVSSG